MSSEQQKRVASAQSIATRLTFVSYDAIAGVITLSNQGCPVWVGALPGGMVGVWGDYGTAMFRMHSLTHPLTALKWGATMGEGYLEEKYRIGMGEASDEFHIDTAFEELEEFVRDCCHEEMEEMLEQGGELPRYIQRINEVREEFDSETTQGEFISKLGEHYDPEAFYCMGEVTRQRVLNAGVIMRRAWELLLAHEPTVQPSESVVRFGMAHDDGHPIDGWHAHEHVDDAIEEFLEWCEQGHVEEERIKARIYVCRMERLSEIDFERGWKSSIEDLDADPESSWSEADVTFNAHTRAQLEAHLETFSKSVHTNLFFPSSRYMTIEVERQGEEEFKVHTPLEIHQWEVWENGRAKRHEW
jgi:hypothetical protein